MCKYFVFLYPVIHHSFCMCVFALLFGNVAFALMTPKTIRGCVIAAQLKGITPTCFPLHNALVQLTVDLN